MNATPRSLQPPVIGARRSMHALVLASLFVAITCAVRADRFIVPTDNSSSSSSSSSSPPPPPPPPSPPPPSAPTYNPPPSNDSGRFIVPTPRNDDRSSGSYTGGGYPGGGYIGGGYRGGGGYYDPFWGGCYYWGGNYYYWGGHYYDSFNHRFSSYRDTRSYDYRTIPSNTGAHPPIFFPPAPPPLGAAIPPRQPSMASIAAPETLAAYVYEPFYASLSTRLFAADLTKKLLQRIDTYRATRTRLQKELLQRIDELQEADPVTRAGELNTLAARQAGDLVKLEADADELRDDLLHGGLVGLFSGTGDWNERRRWRLGEGSLAGPREKTLSAEFRVIRAAAFYQDGLSPAQRRLLREVEMELQVEAFKPKSASPADPDEKLLFFQPETARVALPADLPPALSLKIAAYEKEKSELKTALRDAIYSLDSAPAARRSATLRSLAEEQAPRISTLEALAEDIRSELALLPKPPGAPTPPAFSPALGSRITAYQTEKNALQKTLQSSLDEVRKANGNAVLNLVKKDPAPASGPAFRLEVQKSENSEAVIADARKAIEAFNKTHAERLAQLAKEREAIRTEVSRFATDKEASAGKSVETLLADFYESLQQGERWQHYRYYQIAMLQQGLSPQQRRLLFEVALERLALPLPAGEYPP